MGKKQTDAELRRTALVFLFLEGGGGGNDVLKFCSVGYGGRMVAKFDKNYG